MKPPTIPTICLGTLLALLGAVAAAAEPIALDRLAPLLSVIKPGAEEARWEQIPWMSSLWQARQKAAALGKPILLWEMDGHPLGCV